MSAIQKGQFDLYNFVQSSVRFPHHTWAEAHLLVPPVRFEFRRNGYVGRVFPLMAFCNPDIARGLFQFVQKCVKDFELDVHIVRLKPWELGPGVACTALAPLLHRRRQAIPAGQPNFEGEARNAL
ncbi:MAG: hypothetical protein ABSE87_14225 [Terracidiphilus sp.]|jgi:hypothetical protein